MNKIQKLLPVLLLAFLLISCKKDQVAQEITSPEIPNDTTQVKPPAQGNKGRIIPLGTGSGNLIIDGSNLGLACDDVIKIKGGTYSSINIKNINTGCKITIQNDGLVEIAGNSDHIFLNKVSNLTISGKGTPGITYGFVSRDSPQHRSISVTGAVQNLTVQNFAFKNIGDYVIYFNSGQIVYNGSESSYSNNVKFLNNSCVNTGSFLHMEGGVENGVIRGLVKNLEVAYLDFRNSNSGDAVLAENADDYNIHHNTVIDVNSTNNNHNGIFTMKGSGSFHHNLVRNHQGNAIRAWTRSFGTTPKDVLIYNNTVVNSRKYSGFEVQSFASMIIAGKTTYSNVKVYNNICGKLNTSKDWVGVVVDIYSLEGGKCEVYNNTGFDFPAPNPKSYIVSQQASTVPVETNNKYFATAAEAGIPDINALKIQN